MNSLMFLNVWEFDTTSSFAVLTLMVVASRVLILCQLRRYLKYWKQIMDH